MTAAKPHLFPAPQSNAHRAGRLGRLPGWEQLALLFVDLEGMENQVTRAAAGLGPDPGRQVWFKPAGAVVKSILHHLIQP